METYTVLDCETLACQGGLRYINSFDIGISRYRRGKGFRYTCASGESLKSIAVRRRIEQLAIPPAWTEVWICPHADGHIQAIGRDAEGRKQYIYHPTWHELSTATKFQRMMVMPQALSRIRATVRSHLNHARLTKERVLAAIVRLLDKAHIRVGNEQYVRERDTRGATTLTSEHIRVKRFTVSLDFPGKSGKRNEVEFTDPKVAKLIRKCEEMGGDYLFSYLDSDGQLCQATSHDVNSYLRSVAHEPVTAKDFRTWWGSVTALEVLAAVDEPEMSKTARKRAMKGALRHASELLGNTMAVCRKSYVHPLILSSFEQGTLTADLKRSHSSSTSLRELRSSECRFYAWLRVVSC